VVEPTAARKGGFLERVRKVIDQEEKESPLLPAAIEALGKIGGDDALKFLEKFSEGEDKIAQQAKQAADRIKLRMAD
jgi:hypothetical protein